MIQKHIAELKYQIDWITHFLNNKERVSEYWNRFRYFNTILEITKPTEKSKILDVGCGISSILHFLPGIKYGIDSLADIYKQLYDYPKDINIIQSNCESLPFEDNFFDIIFCSNAFDHFDNIEKANNEIYRVLKPSGYFVIAVEFFEKLKERDKAHPNCLSEQEIYKYVSKYTCLYRRIIPWIGLREYVKGIKKAQEKEILMILQKHDK